MNEGLSADQILRLEAMRMVMGYVTEHIEFENALTPLAKEIYEFIKGETTNV